VHLHCAIETTPNDHRLTPVVGPSRMDFGRMIVVFATKATALCTAYSSILPTAIRLFTNSHIPVQEFTYIGTKTYGLWI